MPSEFRTSNEARAVIGVGVKRSGNEGWGVASHTGVQIVAIVECFRKCIDTAELETIALVAVQVNFQTLMGTDPFGEPVRGVPNGFVGQSSSGRK